MRLSARVRIQYSLSIFVLLAVGALFFILQHHRARQASTLPPAYPVSSQAPPSHAINGFRFTSNQAGHLSIDIQADRFVLKKKKMGMFRLGLINEALFRNVHIDLYGKRRQTTDNVAVSSEAPPGTVYIEAPEIGETYAFSHAFSPEHLASLRLKKIAAVRMAPIAMRFWVEDQVKIRVRADQAVLAASPRQMELKGNVRWHSGDTELQTDSLVVIITDNKIEAPGAYRIKREAKVLQGRKLETDFLLQDTPGLTTAFGPRAGTFTGGRARGMDR
jgi:hypothetical protein